MSLKNGERCRTQTTPSCADNTSSGLLATARKKKTQHESLTRLYVPFSKAANKYFFLGRRRVLLIFKMTAILELV